MKTKIIQNALTALILLSTSVSSYANSGNNDKDDKNDKNNDYAYYIMSPKNYQSSVANKSLRLIGKSGETKSVAFQGSVQIPASIRVNAGLLRIGSASAYLVFDNVQCKYETTVNKSFFNFSYPLVSCTDGSRANQTIQVNSKISLYLKETKLFPATAFADMKVLSTYVKGISLPQLEADKGQILRFDGELWVPTDYIPDGQTTGDVLMWDGKGWAASKISAAGGATGEKGEKGDTGATGPQGPQGERGPTGLTGLTGQTGAAGAKGDVGAAGAKGDTGAKGDAGAVGPMGSMGPAGASGSMGPMGLMGPAGMKGDKGDKGDAGIQGATGAQGPQGLPGAKGDKGDAGIQGATGAQGPQGLAGAKGDKGDTGLQGEAGAVGAKGDKGDKGDAGLQGATGAQGPQGLAGAAGMAGAKGDKGDTGDAGTVSLTAGTGILGGTIQGNGGVIAVNTGIAAGQIPVIGTNGRLPASIVPDAIHKIVYIKDLKPSGTNGGACDPAKGWEQVRDLNSLTGDTSFANIASNTITLAAGTYDIEINAPAYLDGFHKAILTNAQTGEIVLIGSNARSHNVSGGMEPSHIVGALTLTDATSFVIKHRCATLSSTGFGASTGFGVDEVYTQVKITKAK